jgi:hypothetical protein
LSSELRVIILSALVFSCGGVLLSYISEEVIAESVEGPSVNQTQAVESAGETYIVTLKDQNSSEDRDDIIKSVQIPMEKKTEIMYSLVTDMRVETIEPDQTMTLPTTPS